MSLNIKVFLFPTGFPTNRNNTAARERVFINPTQSSFIGFSKPSSVVPSEPRLLILPKPDPV